MSIFQVATEIAPIAKVGGLADVVYGLSKELVATGHDVKIILPYYDFLKTKKLCAPKVICKSTFSCSSHTKIPVTYYDSKLEDLPLVLVKAEDKDHSFERGSIYGQMDDSYRFLLFLYLTMHYFETCEKPSLIHLHDWPTSFLAYLYKCDAMENSPLDPKIILTLHNMLHQGRTSKKPFEKLGIECSHLFKDDKLLDQNNPTLLNLLKAGISYADNITTVSPTYSKEIQTREFGYALDGALTQRKEALKGILNGIDHNYWNPSKDNSLKKEFPTTFQFEKIMKAKKANKEKLQTMFNLKDSKSPLFCTVSRLDTQKGPELIEHAITFSLDRGAQFFLLGSASDPLVKKQFEEVKEKYKGNPNFHMTDVFDENVARLVYAAADFIVIPSSFEPCGLTQMIAMRYYCIPIVRKTGGLADSVVDIDQDSALAVERVGFVFESKEKHDLEQCIERALALYLDKESYEEILSNHALQDFSWERSAKAYLKVYSK
ncbi:MAG: Glycogen synthase [Chlamydiia bacterium]|nr:Glycogen synthase [Chlamydiia bacterium]